MDKVPYLLANNGVWGVLLAVIAVTDIPKSFFSALIKWFFEKKDKPYWPAAPIRSNFIWPVLGLLRYNKTKITREQLFLEVIKEKRSRISELIKEIGSAPITFKQFRSRASIDLSKKTINVINGLPGAGKSSFILNYLQQMHYEGKVDFVFYFDLYSISRVYPGLRNGMDRSNEQQVWQEIGKYNLDFANLSPALLSYLLNYRSVYFIIDGVDREEECENIIQNLHRYIQRYHSKNKKLKVLISSRLDDYKLQQLIINDIELPPLTENEIKEFFFMKTEELGMNLTRHPYFGSLVDPQTSILRFQNRLTQTPLFAEVVVVILKSTKLENVIDEFHKSVANIYKLFIRVLFERSGKGMDKYDDFSKLYRDLAYKTWRSGNQFEIEEVNEVFAKSPFDAQFMLDSGLLIKSDKKYGFIHQTIPDVLAIELLVKNNNFQLFEGESYLREDLQTYLKDEVKTISQYVALLNASPNIASAFLDRAFFNKISQQDMGPGVRMIARTCIEYTVNHKELKTSDQEAILRMVKNLSEWRSDIYDVLLDELQTFPKTKGLIVLLLNIQLKVINDFIVRLILSNESRNILMSILGDNIYLKGIITPYFHQQPLSDEGKAIIQFALEADISNNQKAFKLLLLEKVPYWNDSEVSLFLKNDKLKREVFFREYVNKDISTTIRLNKLLSVQGVNEIFLPKGTYRINGETVQNIKTITFLKEPYQKDFNEQNVDVAIKKMQNEVPNDLWSFEQFRIAYAYFEGTIANKFNGFLGLSSFPDIRYEAVKENNKYKVSFGYFESKGGKTDIVTSGAVKERFKQRILWRSIQQH